MLVGIEPEGSEYLFVTGVRNPAVWADPADKTLWDEGEQAAIKVIPRNPEVVEVADRAGGIRAMQRAENQDAGQRGADADPGSFVIANLADHDDVGILAEHRPQSFA